MGPSPRSRDVRARGSQLLSVFRKMKKPFPFRFQLHPSRKSLMFLTVSGNGFPQTEMGCSTERGKSPPFGDAGEMLQKIN